MAYIGRTWLVKLVKQNVNCWYKNNMLFYTFQCSFVQQFWLAVIFWKFPSWWLDGTIVWFYFHNFLVFRRTLPFGFSGFFCLCFESCLKSCLRYLFPVDWILHGQEINFFTLTKKKSFSSTENKLTRYKELRYCCILVFMDQFLEQRLITHQLLDIRYTELQRLWWGQENVLPQGKKVIMWWKS